MNNKIVSIFNSIAVTAILAVTTPAWANPNFDGGGYGAGNGGTAVICVDPQTQQETVQLLDLWEHSRTDVPGLHLTIPMKQDSVERQVTDAINRFLGSRGALENTPDLLKLKTEILDEIAHVFERFADPSSYLRPGNVIQFPHEKLPATRPENCAYSSIVSYQLDGTMVINRLLLDKIRDTPTQLAALVVHEALYRLARDLLGADESVLVRELVASLFSDEVFPKNKYSQEHEDVLRKMSDTSERISKFLLDFMERQNHAGPRVLRLNHHRSRPGAPPRLTLYARTDQARGNDCILDIKVINSYGHDLQVSTGYSTVRGLDVELDHATIDFSEVSRKAQCFVSNGMGGTSKSCRKGWVESFWDINDSRELINMNVFKTGKYRLWVKMTCDNPAELVIRVPREKVVLQNETVFNDNELVVIPSGTEPTIIQLK